MAEDIAYMVLVGAGGLMTIVAGTYAAAYAVDRCCSSAYSTERVFSPVSNRANLWGMSFEERVAVLERLFAEQDTMQKYDKTKEVEKGICAPGDDIEMTELKPRSVGKKTATQADATRGHHHDPSSAPTELDESTSMEVVEIPVSVGSNASEGEEQGTAPDDDDLEANSLSFLSAEGKVNICSICLAEFENGDSVMTGTQCFHLYHVKCIMEWMEKGNDHCPFCRKFMMTPQEMRAAALHVLGPKQVRLLARPDMLMVDQEAPPPSPTQDSSAAGVAPPAEGVAPLVAGGAPSPVVAVGTGDDNHDGNDETAQADEEAQDEKIQQSDENVEVSLTDNNQEKDQGEGKSSSRDEEVQQSGESVEVSLTDDKGKEQGEQKSSSEADEQGVVVGYGDLPLGAEEERAEECAIGASAERGEVQPLPETTDPPSDSNCPSLAESKNTDGSSSESGTTTEGGGDAEDYAGEEEDKPSSNPLPEDTKVLHEISKASQPEDWIRRVYKSEEDVVNSAGKEEKHSKDTQPKDSTKVPPQIPNKSQSAEEWTERVYRTEETDGKPADKEEESRSDSPPPNNDSNEVPPLTTNSSESAEDWTERVYKSEAQVEAIAFRTTPVDDISC